MTEEEISDFMARLQQEDDMLRRDRLRSFDGSALCDQSMHRLAVEVLGANPAHKSESPD